MPRSKPVLRIELDRETHDPIGKSCPYGSRADAASSVGKTSQYVAPIISQHVGHYFIEFYGQLFTFVDANSTQKEIDEHIEKIKQHFLEKSIVVVYLDSSYSPTGEASTFKNRTEAEECTGVNGSLISTIKNQNPGKYTATDRNGDIVTFFSGDKTEEEQMKFIEKILDEKESITTYSKPVLRIELARETYDPIGKSFPYGSRAEAARSVGKTPEYITQIINQHVGHYFIEFYGQLFTFVEANSTQKEIDAHIEKIKQHFIEKSVIVLYLDSSYSHTGETKKFKNRTEAEECTGVDGSLISAIKNQNPGRYTATDRNGNIVTFFSGKTTEEERIKFIEEIKTAKEPLI